MISSGSCKELYTPFENDRCDALKNSSALTDDELEYLGVTRTQGGGVNDSETYLIDSTPVDSETDAANNAVDIRKIPGHD